MGKKNKGKGRGRGGGGRGRGRGGGQDETLPTPGRRESPEEKEDDVVSEETPATSCAVQKTPPNSATVEHGGNPAGAVCSPPTSGEKLGASSSSPTKSKTVSSSTAVEEKQEAISTAPGDADRSNKTKPSPRGKQQQAPSSAKSPTQSSKVKGKLSL